MRGGTGCGGCMVTALDCADNHKLGQAAVNRGCSTFHEGPFRLLQQSCVASRESSMGVLNLSGFLTEKLLCD